MTAQRRRAVVFGGTGFIGRHIVARLARDGWEVVVASRHPERALASKTMGDVGQVVPIATDVLSDADIRNAMQGADTAVSLVGVLHESGKRTFSAIHTEAPGRIGAAATAAGVPRLVHVSALGAAPDAPSAYARSKAAGEATLRAAYPGATILRPSVVFGEGDGLFTRFAGLARALPALPLFGGGKTRFQPVWVEDVAAAAVIAATQAGHAGRTVGLGGPSTYSLRQIMELTLRYIGRRRPLIPIPWGLARVQASLLSWLPEPPITRDQLLQLSVDNVLASDDPGLAAFRIRPTPAEAVLPLTLARFRRPAAS
jgi:NADH dehydrogenase